MASADYVAEVYRRHYPTLVRLAMTVTGEHEAAQDLVHDVFADYHRLVDEVEHPSRWLVRATVNRARSWIRRRVTARRYAPTLAGSKAGPAVQGAEGLAVRRALAGLSVDQRAVLFLRFWLDLSEAEIAATLGVAPGTVKSRVSRGLRRLREELDDAD